MDWDVKRDGRALRRIVMLLIALADLAERAAAMPFATRAAVLAILRPAEAAAWAFALGAPVVSPAFGRDCARHQLPPLEAACGGVDDAAELARMAAALRLLALFVARWAVEDVLTAAEPSPVRCSTLRRSAPAGSGRGPAALPAPDTS
jgi:hypothetical protein